jgi:hypothetical protein
MCLVLEVLTVEHDDDKEGDDDEPTILVGSTVLFPELISCRKPRSVLDTGLEENTVLGRTRDVSPPCVRPARVFAADDGDSIGSSRSLSSSAVSMLRRFSSRLGSLLSGMMVPGLETVRKTPPLVKRLAETGGCMDEAETVDVEELERRW